MIKIMFVCLGNICRSPMAEFVFKNMIEEKGIANQFYVSSSATSNEEVGNPVHYGTKNKLFEMGISVKGKYAVQLSKKDYKEYDFIIVMEQSNIRDVLRIVGDDTDNKVYKLLDFAGGGDIADPWYTGNFDVTYKDVLRGCEGLLKYLYENNFLEE